MAPFLRKLLYLEPVKYSLDLDSTRNQEEDGVVGTRTTTTTMAKKKKMKVRSSNAEGKKWRCFDCCCWMIGYLCTVWWLLLLLFNNLPDYITGFRIPESPGIKLRKEGLIAHHPVVLVPGIVTGGLELWEGRPCAAGLFRKRLWGGTFAEIFRRPLCWLEHMSLDNETGLDPPGIRVRAVPGLVAADYFAPGYFVWAVLIENLARIGYEGKNMHMTAYDWRLSFQNTEFRDQSLSRLKSKIELMVKTNDNKKVVVVPHSMGALYFLHFLKWVEALPPMGGGGGPGWCAKHIKTIMNIGPAFLGVPKVVSNVFSAEAKDIAFIRAMAPGILDSDILGLQTLEHIMRVSRTWDSIMSLLPKGGETIWGNMDWSPEEGHDCDPVKKNSLKTFGNEPSGRNNISNGKLDFRIDDKVHYGRLISFGKLASQLSSTELLTADPKELSRPNPPLQRDSLCRELWTEYDEMSRDSIQKVAEKKMYTAGTLLDLLRFVAPRLMQRADAHFSHGIADNLDDPKYSHYKYWSNPLETKLPYAPDMEIHCLYGVGIPTERSYVYKVSPSAKCGNIPFRIDSSADGGENGGCLRGGVYLVDGDESVPVLSSGFMCARGWRGRSKYNPSGIATYVREYQHKPPATLLEGRGLHSGSHVDIMGNVDLIEDIMRVAAGASGKEVGGDRIYSGILEMSERINLRF